MNCDEVLGGGGPVMAPVFSGRSLGAWVRRLRASMARFGENLVPLGYEDAAGFHFGIDPAERRGVQHRQKDS